MGFFVFLSPDLIYLIFEILQQIQSQYLKMNLCTPKVIAEQTFSPKSHSACSEFEVMRLS